MVKRIDSISPEQEARFPEWVEKWTKIGLSTERADVERATVAVKKLYEIINQPQPKKILFAQSPFQAVKMGTYEVKKLENPSIKMEDIPNSEFYSSVNNLYGGSFYASWASFVTFFRDVMDLECDSFENFFWGEELTHSCGWVWWHDDICVIVDRPTLIKMDDENRLHNETGPAIEYADGYAIYSWHGVQIPDEWITDKDNLDPSIALTWENVEQRRCAAEIIGWARVLEKLDCKVIDKDPDPEIGELLEVDIPEIGKERFLKVLCGTGRTFALPVPPEMKTALEAQSWTWGLDSGEFLKPEIRT